MTNAAQKNVHSSSSLPEEEKPLTPDDFTAMGHTPMMAQYMSVKVAHPECLLFYRMGDFYELFFDDALIASAVLDITLTKRGKTQGEEIAMCGVPFHSCEPYIARLIRAGHKVAICEQTETPEQAKKRGGSKALVMREVIRIITPGTLIEDNLLNARANNFLAAYAESGTEASVCFSDVSTGEFFVQSLPKDQAFSTLQRLEASEILLPDHTSAHYGDDRKDTLTPLPAAYFDSAAGAQKLEALFGKDFTDFTRSELAACHALIRYIDDTQKGKMPHLLAPRRIASSATMEIDPSTMRSLELVRTQNGEKNGSLLDSIDMTLTGAGARMLRARLVSPLQDTREIRHRHDEIATLIAAVNVTREIRTLLKQLPDMERALARLSLMRGGPRDLGALRDGLGFAGQIKAMLIESHLHTSPLGRITDGLTLPPATDDFLGLLKDSLEDSPPFLARDGNFIREGFCVELDKFRGLKKEARQHIAALQAKYIEETGIDSLKITYNNILGYFIEVPARRADKLMIKDGDGGSNNPFIHRQTMATAVRFTTAELAELERDISSASDKALAIEERYFADFTQQASTLADDINVIAQSLAALDVATSNATLAIDRAYTRPDIVETNENAAPVFAITGGRHPVVERALQKNHTTFAPNDCALQGHESLWLLTGPNMAGKSTFLRQNALIVIMAQAGFYVPASGARLSVVDKVFSRVGASDDLAKGQSTFMMEMVETATILGQATARSLVILDEIGRGTATYDGLSIAWATLEFLHNRTKCRGLFATHYHELTNLSSQLNHLACYTMEVREWKNDVIFLHHVKKGTADRSYGIHVARLAGLPDDVLARAEQILDLLETHRANKGPAAELPLFQLPPPPPAKPTRSPALEKLDQVNPDSLSPREALDLIYELKRLDRNRT